MYNWSMCRFAPPAISVVRNHCQVLSSCLPLPDGRSGMISRSSCTSALGGCPGYPHGELLNWKPMHLRAPSIPRLHLIRTQNHTKIRNFCFPFLFFFVPSISTCTDRSKGSRIECDRGLRRPKSRHDPAIVKCTREAVCTATF